MPGGGYRRFSPATPRRRIGNRRRTIGIWLRPVTPGGANAGETTSFFLSPIGGGPDGQQPYATSGDDRPDHRQHPFPVAKRLKPGGYTIEACIPAAAVAGFEREPREAWHVELMYQNVNEI